MAFVQKYGWYSHIAMKLGWRVKMMIHHGWPTDSGSNSSGFNISDAERQHHFWRSDSFSQQIAESNWTSIPKLRQHHPPLRRHPQSNFAHCSAVPQPRQAVYVGTILTDAADNKKEIQNDVALANKTYVQSKLFWDKANTNTNTLWKLRAFNSVINSKCLIWARKHSSWPTEKWTS